MNIRDGDWLFVRLSKEWGGSPQSIRTEWTIYDVLDAVEYMDLESAAHEIAREESEKK